MVEFKVGDKIKLIENVVSLDKYSHWDYGIPLKDLIGKEIIIEQIDTDGDIWHRNEHSYLKPEMVELVVKLRVGDKVKLKDNLVLGEVYNGWLYNEYRSHRLGEELKIVEVSDGGIFGGFNIKVDGGNWFGSDMFELVSKTDIPYESDIQSIEWDTVEVDDFEDIHGLNIGREQVEDVVNHPSHYNNGSIEAIEVIEDWKLNFHLGNAVKYINRAEHKGKYKQDIEKAIWYLNRAIES